MVTVRSLKTSEAVSIDELDDIHQDVKRMIRRARAMNQSRVFLRESLKNFMEFLNTFQAFDREISLEDLWSLLDKNREECMDTIRPFRSFFHTHGLLPDDVSDDSLLAFVIHEADARGLLDLT